MGVAGRCACAVAWPCAQPRRCAASGATAGEAPALTGLRNPVLALSSLRRYPLPAVLRVPTHCSNPSRVSRVALNRHNIILRDQGRCQYCGSVKNLTIDHVVPQVGGWGGGGGACCWEWQRPRSHSPCPLAHCVCSSAAASECPALGWHPALALAAESGTSSWPAVPPCAPPS